MPRDGRDLGDPRVWPGVADVLVLTTFDLDEYVFGALRAGAAGFLLKDTDAADAGGRGAAGRRRRRARRPGGHPPADRGVRRPAGAAPPDLPRAGDADRRASARCSACLGAGLSNVEIGDRLGMTEATTKTHVSRMLAKLGLRSRVQAAMLAQEHGLQH